MREKKRFGMGTLSYRKIESFGGKRGAFAFGGAEERTTTMPDEAF